MSQTHPLLTCQEAATNASQRSDPASRRLPPLPTPIPHHPHPPVADPRSLPVHTPLLPSYSHCPRPVNIRSQSNGEQMCISTPQRYQKEDSNETELPTKYRLHWLVEDAKRRQEEERTRQEGLRLERRKFELDMLQASLSAGIPPSMIPLIFTGMTGGGVTLQANAQRSQQIPIPAQAPSPRRIMSGQWHGPLEKQQGPMLECQHHHHFLPSRVPPARPTAPSGPHDQMTYHPIDRFQRSPPTPNQAQ
ncbi:hypothetical protein FGLOB1_14330 [Fusarium globosum]|uniref:Uncharacterized protein n=1 Tax=Fusarium globosum TaxID=78864 RepID=A0A8H6CVL2_9HYPO|nr:hypothetical protein FGLOB1_14330 [Fusarium globosum]